MSRIEQLIGEIEEYIDSCKFSPLSNTKIQVNKEELEELLVELRLRIPGSRRRLCPSIANKNDNFACRHDRRHRWASPCEPRCG